MRRALALLTLALLSGCTTRDRSNPLDPRNPGTGGRPGGFAAIAGNAQVFLNWSATDARLGVGFSLERQVEGDPDFTPLAGTLPPGTSSYLDLGVSNGITYHYRLRFVSPVSTSPYAQDEATPSPVIPWVADAGRRSLVRLSADGRHVALEEPGIETPFQLAVDKARDNVWVVDPDAGRVLIYLPGVGARVNVPGFLDPEYVAVDRLSGAAWVSDYDGGRIVHVLPSGGPGTPASIDNLDHPLGLDVDPVSGVLWACIKGTGRVRRYASGGAFLGQSVIVSPTQVAIDSSNGEAWVTSLAGRLLVHYAANGGEIASYSTFRGPVGVAVDTYRSRIWIADPVAGEVVAMQRNGTEEFRVRGLPGAREVAVETGSGEAWVAATGTVVRISAAGAVILTAGDLASPSAIAFDRFAR
jgi:DNA-binding beta-propeller fold protein YncE